MTSTTVRRFVIAMEILCSLLALVILVFGIYTLFAYNYGFNRPVSAAFTFIGGTTIVVFLFNGYGFVKGGVCCITSFLIFFLLVILVQIVAAVLLLQGIRPAASAIANTIDVAWEQEINSAGGMSLYEDWLSCCGRVSAQDYIVNNRDPPATCFRNQDKSSPNNLIVEGCRLQFENYWHSWLFIIMILSWVLIAMETITSTLLCCLCNNLRNERRRQFI